MSRPRPTPELMSKAIEMSVDYYSRISSWEQALYLDMEPGHEQVLPEVQEAFDSVHPDIQKHYMGVGPLSINLVEGLRVLDLGSGYGRDVFAYSKLVGEHGFVMATDITTVESNFARERIDYHREKYGYKKSNVEFRKASMTDLSEADIKDNSYDLIISNGAACMVPDMEAVYDEVNRTLKVSGEFHYYTVYADQRVTPEMMETIFNDSDLAGHGLGCTYWRDQVDGLKDRGMTTPRIVDVVKAWAKGKKALDVIGGIRYMYVSYRAFKLPAGTSKEPCRVTYKGTILNCQNQLRFDYFTTFKTGETIVADGELCAILKGTRYAPHFTFTEMSDADTVQTSSPVVDPFTLVKW